MALSDFFMPLKMKAPEITYFDHLVGEFESIEMAITGGATGPAERRAATTAAQPPGEAAAAQADEATGEIAQDAAQQTQAGAAIPQAKDVARAETAALARQPADSTLRILREAKEKVAQMKLKRDDETLDWSDLYHLELILADVRPIGALRVKVLSLRHDYRSVAGQVEYDEYLASKPKNLLDPPDPRNPPDANADYEMLLRDDMKDLLDRLFKRYAFLPIREMRLKRLTILAATICGLFLVILIGAILSMNYNYRSTDQSAAGNSNSARADSNAARGNSNDNRAVADSAQQAAGGDAENRRPLLPSIALFVVLVSGAMGGFLSALQRIQSSPTEGDSIYNLSMLYHGSYAVFVAPLTGAVFAILLYFMFTGHILEGRFFPDIYTPSAAIASATPSPPPTPTQPAATEARPPAAQPADAANRRPAPTPQTVANTNAQTSTNTNAANTNTANANAASANTNNANTSTSTASTNIAVATPTPRQVATASLHVKEFLYDSGPAGGQDYALLIIWSFIAGFAERFVPDSLNRLVAGKQASGQSGT